jgi:hypothetical protein
MMEDPKNTSPSALSSARALLALHGSASLRDYDPAVFSALPDFPFARARLAEAEGQIEEVGDIICKYGFHDIVGLNLLHKHFEISPDEIIVRHFDADAAYMSPRAVTRCEQECVPYLWAYVPSGGNPGWYPLEFVATEQVHNVGDLVLLQYADLMLDELGAKLVERGLETTFGIAALFSRTPLQPPPGHTLLETTDEAGRILTLRSAPEHEVRTADTTKTLWIFTPGPIL